MVSDFGHLAGLCKLKRSDMYKGASPFKTLKTKSKNLNSILKLTGSQCKES